MATDAFDAMCDLTIRWLNGEVEETPWYLGHPEPETKQIIPYLIHMNENGYFTINSDPGGRSLLWKARPWVMGYCDYEHFKALSHLDPKRFIVRGFEKGKTYPPEDIITGKYMGTPSTGVINGWFTYGPEMDGAIQSRVNFHVVGTEWGKDRDFWEVLCAQF